MFAVFLIILYLHLCATKQTLWDVVQTNSNTTKFAMYIKDAQVDSQLQMTGCGSTAATDCITLFAPNNAALEAAAGTINWDQINAAQKMLFIGGHIFRDTGPLNTEAWYQKGQPMNLIDIGFGSGRLYELSYNTQRYMFQSAPVPQYGPNSLYFVGAALVIEPNLAASNGVMQVVNNILYTPDSSSNFLSYLIKQSDLTISAQLWTILGSDPTYMPFINQLWNNKNIYATFFVVTNDGWAQIPKEQLALLRMNKTLLASVLANHYLPNQLAFVEWTAVQPTVNFFTGFPTDPKATDTSQLTRGSMDRLIDGSVIVNIGGSSATIEGKSKQIQQAVLLRITAPVGFVYETLEQILTRMNAQLLAACRTDSTCNALLINQADLTVFSPTPESMQRFAALTAEQKSTVLRYLFLPGKIVRNQITNLKMITVDGLTDAIRFRINGQNVFLDGRLKNKGYVPTQLTVFDQMATNGVVHVIDGLPGIPNEKVEDYLTRTVEFSKFAAYQFVQSMTLGAPYTFCAPTNDAILAMESSSTVGLRILQDKKLRDYVFRRHTFPRQLLLEDLKIKPYDAATANYAFTREEVRLTVANVNNGRVGTITFEGQTAEIATQTGSFEFTNGWLYTLDKIIYSSNDLTRALCNQRGCP